MQINSEPKSAAETFVDENLTPEEKEQLDEIKSRFEALSNDEKRDVYQALTEQPVDTQQTFAHRATATRARIDMLQKNDKPSPLEIAVRAEMMDMNRHQRRAWLSKQSRKVGVERGKRSAGTL